MSRLTRRGFLAQAGAAAGACAPMASPSGQGGSADTGGRAAWEDEWDQLVAAAKQEGRLVIQTLAGSGYRKALQAFEQAFPGIEIEHTGIATSSWAPKFLQERQAGLYNWDVTDAPPITGFSLFPEAVYDPIRPLLYRPDVLDDRSWVGGFEVGFLDTEKKWVFQAGWDLGGGLWVNPDMVAEGEIKSSLDLLAPKWRGKIVSFDPRTGGLSSLPVSVMRLKHGEDAVKKLYVDQEAVIVRDNRQLTEFVVRGRYPIGIGTTTTVVDDFRKEGLGGKIKNLLLEDFSYLSGSCLWFVNRAPHPNAAKLYINWLLTKEGQQAFTKEVLTNSRRTDVAPADPAIYPPEGAEKRYTNLYTQERWVEVEKTREIMRGHLK